MGFGILRSTYESLERIPCPPGCNFNGAAVNGNRGCRRIDGQWFLYPRQRLRVGGGVIRILKFTMELCSRSLYPASRMATTQSESSDSVVCWKSEQVQYVIMKQGRSIRVPLCQQAGVRRRPGIRRGADVIVNDPEACLLYPLPDVFGHLGPVRLFELFQLTPSPLSE